MRIQKAVIKDEKILCQMIRDISFNARRGELSDAASLMNLFLQKFQKYLSSDKVDPEKVKDISYSLETLLMLQEQKDWIAVADILEHELINFLK